MLEIVATGALNSIQDRGRERYRRYGVGVAGAMDRLALELGNAMLGNSLDAAGIEITLPPFRVRFHTAVGFSITGADTNALLDGDPLPPYWTAHAHGGSELSFGAAEQGARAYLLVEGGMDVPRVLDSRSTDLKAGFGGFHGRSLRKGDLIRINAAGFRNQEHGWPSDFGIEPPGNALRIDSETEGNSCVAVRVLPARDIDVLTANAIRAFWRTPWAVTPQSDRAGLRLAGPTLETHGHSEKLSHGIVPGVIQLPPNGLPIIQASDANTTGGYPIVGVVIGADLWRLGQVPIGGRLRFLQTTPADAIRAEGQVREWVERLRGFIGAMQGPVRRAGPISLSDTRFA
ncbi:MAG: biotin-dependent carboxyltransferase family protein [Burkholderiaceae bacterium]|nr:biotin-dependent carboxyltransferase family protein [Burkholderiaceae bacterium]